MPMPYSLLMLLISWALIVLSMPQISSGCFFEEKQALLHFKASINETQHALDHLVLPSWTDDEEEGGGYDHRHYSSTGDCCKWERVKCSDTTRRIVELRLRNLRQSIFQSYGDFRDWFLNLSVFLPLGHLETLDLSYNSFDARIFGCEQLASFKNLEFLFLDYNKFNGSIFPCLASLPSLKNLSLAYNGEMGSFPLKEINHWKQLKHLDLSSNAFSGPLSFKELKLKNLKLLNIGRTFFNELRSIEVMTSLKALSLSYNSFNDSSVLQGICSMKNLVELDLSGNGFSGSVPLCLSKLTSLVVLDISNNNFSGNIPPLVITSLAHLEYLTLSENHFEGSFSFSSFANHSNLQILTLSPLSNGLYVDFDGLALPPPFQLRVLELGKCNLKGKNHRVPNFFLYQKELRVLDLSSNNLVDKIPLWLLENNKHLEVLELGNNSFTGPFQMDGTIKRHLVRLDISNNKVGGQVPQDIGLFFPILTYLNLSSNSFEGSIPESLGNLTSVYSIDLSNNNFSGKVPDRIGTGCVQLENLLLSNNRLQGNFPSSSMNLTRLEVLYLDKNYLSGPISQGLSRSPNLQFLVISSNEFQGNIPSWIGNFSSLETLELSGNLLEGTLPNDICKLTMLSFLDLSENNLNGSIPSCSSISSLRFIHLQKNQITGPIPNTLLQNLGLMTLDLRYNHLSRGIPRDIVTLAELRVLLLGGNNLRGQIPGYICRLKKLTIMDLSHNNFSGRIPSCLGNMSFGRGHFADDSFYNWDGGFIRSGSLKTFQYNSSLTLYQFLLDNFVVSDVQEEVEFTTKSRLSTYAGNILNYMSGLDLSCNRLTGEIPAEMSALTDIRAMNLSHNFLQGSIPPKLSMLNLIESLDLSYNNLTGQIPPELTNLNFLSIFNVSYNNLSGRAPDKGQFANFDEDNYRGNPNLCGQLLERRCGGAAVANPEPNVGGEETDGDGAIDTVAFFWSFFPSFVVAVSTLALGLYVSRQCRRAWFGFIDKWILSTFSQRYRFHSKSR